MNPAEFKFISIEWLVYLANIATVSIVACGTSLVIVGFWRKGSLPIVHAILVIAFVVSLVSPFLLASNETNPLSLFTLNLNGASLEAFPIQRQTTPDVNEISLISADERKPNPPTVAVNEAVDASNTQANAAKTADEKAAIAPATPQWSWVDAARAAGCVLASVWAIGAAYCLGRLAVGYVQVRRFLRGLRPIESGDLFRWCACEAAQLRLRKAPPLYESAALQAPLTLGLVRTVVVLPASIEAFSVKQIQGMLLHELAHVARHDHLVGMLQRLALVGFWWNPLVHRVSARISTMRERICDDLATGEVGSAESYAAMLVELAGRVAAARPLPATIGIFESSGQDFKTRVCRLLDSDRPMVVRLDQRMKLLCAGMLIVMVASVLATTVRVQADSAAVPEAKVTTDSNQPTLQPLTPKPAAPKTPISENSTEALPLKWPKRLTGTVKNEQGKPIDGAKVRFDLEKVHEYSIGRWDETIYTKETTTDKDGNFSYDATSLPALTHRPFVLIISCTSPGYADAKWWSWYSRSDSEVESHLASVKMEAGRVVRGRCVDGEGKPVANVVVKAASDYDPKSPASDWAWDPRQTDGNGEFEISIPHDSKRAVELWAAPSSVPPKNASTDTNYHAWKHDLAPQHVVVPKSGDQLADIRLRRGSKIHGTVLKQDGSPAEGVVVAARSVFGGNLTTVAFSVDVATKTDAAGHYELPPLEGIYQVFLSQAEKTDDCLKDRFVVGTQAPPLVVPQKLALSGVMGEKLDFREGPTLTASGYCRWADGKPVVGMEVSANYLPENFGTGVVLGKTKTDGEGHYSFKSPRPIDELSISAYGVFDADHKWCYAHADEKIEAYNKGLQFIMLNDVKHDRSDLDWIVRPDAFDVKKINSE